jgi:trans-L-3-hydroxyproline dehydratase
MFEPRGHADMYGAVITEPVTPDGDFGVFFMHNEGYSTMCGHAVIALTKLVLETGMVKKSPDDPFLRIDAPPGRIIASGTFSGQTVVQSTFVNVPSFVLLQAGEVEVPGLGRVRFDIAFGGAFYAICQAGPLGLKLDPQDYQRLIDQGRRIKQAVVENHDIVHPFEKDLGFLYGTIFTGPASLPGNHSRNVCIFADGEVDRSATGSGVSARAALHHARGEMEVGRSYVIESILGSTMTVKINETSHFGPHTAVIPEVSGSAWYTGKHEFLIDPEDPLKSGFIFR